VAAGSTATRKRGRERREKLVQAAYDLLSERPIEEISFREIAERAEIPEGSAYHFYSNRFNDQEVGRIMHSVFSKYFNIPDSEDMHTAFYFFIEITDLIFTLSVIEHGKITKKMLAESKRAGVSYLGTYIDIQ
jgi:AcrR family transcriptional regulator